jgi:uncharacterized protein (TIGR02147 family)
MKSNVFDYKDYKNYLNESLVKMPSKGRGVRLKIALHLGCQTSFISQVLNHATQFSLEQAVKLNQFFGHGRDESKFFLLLVQYQRAGSSDLKNFIKLEMDEILEKRQDLKQRLNIKDNLDEQNQFIYYSVWYYAAIHILLSIPNFQTPKAIANHLSLELEQVHDVIDFLCETGLAIQKLDRFIIGTTRIHLAADSIQIRRHHNNWRNQAINSIDNNHREDLHYSNVLSISKKDIPRVKEILIKNIEECRDIIKLSPEEELQILTIDFFKL